MSTQSYQKPNTLSIGVFVNYWLGWGGGKDFLENFVCCTDPKYLRIDLLLLDLNAGDCLTDDRDFLLTLFSPEFCDLIIARGMKFYSISSENFLKDISLTVDFVGFCGGKPIVDFLKEKWVSYIPDLLHEKFPNQLGLEECLKRDDTFRSMIAESAVTIVHSQENRRRLEQRYVGGYSCSKIRVALPPLPFFTVTRALNVEVSLPEKYFVVCSQAWAHKNYDVIIKAFSKYLRKNYEFSSDKLIFTGSLFGNDSGLSERLQDTISSLGLNDSVLFVGKVDKSVQLRVIERSIALITASLNEGGATASGIGEATLLQKIILCSNIPEHINWSLSLCYYFEATDHTALSKLMLNARVGALSTPVGLELSKFQDSYSLIHTLSYVNILSGAVVGELS
jgi:glycosyltransferase involved in cell wall biosynthesis